MQQLPESLNALFWDINIQKFNPFDYPVYTIARILEFGDEEAFGWLKSNFSEETIKNVIKSNRQLSPRSANFWAVIFNVPINKVFSLNKLSDL
jgi:hypothetical protein